MNFKKIAISGAAAATLFGMSAVAVLAATSYSLFGDASIVSGGNPGNAAQIRSDASVSPSYGGVEVTPSVPIAWASLTTLSTDFNVTDDSCGGGSPRVSVGIDTNNDSSADGYVHIALGPSPSFTGCTTGWQSSGNLIGNTDAGRFDYSQFGGSTFTTYADAPASVQSGQVVSVSMVVDGSWNSSATNGDSEQTVLVDNITLNSYVTTFDPEAVKVLSGKATGGLTLKGPKQQISFNAFDYGASNLDEGTVEYQNFEYPGGLHYTANLVCANVKKATSESWFAFQIPAGYPGLSGLYVISYVKDGGTPGTKGDIYGHTATSDLATAKSWCETGTAPIGNYQVTGGNAVVHK